MKRSAKYDTSGAIEDIYEPGSHGRVLKNKLGIRNKQELDRVETDLHLKTLNKLIHLYDREHCFTVKDICFMHQEWLGKVYDWAGKFRCVNISKGNLQFAAAKYIPNLMKDFENQVLNKYTPCLFENEEEIAEALAVVHVELILIHPFREGNGRVARMLSAIMGLQAKLPSLDFNMIRGRKKQEYFAAVRKGLDRDYNSMKKIFLATF